jgi:peptidoglycan/xylan/chitin deacetylase (PgdA/CDA1 family)
MSLALQQEEIERSKSMLEDVLGRPCASFAFPYGCYSDDTVAIVRHAGFSAACSTHEAAVDSRADLFQLPRIHVQDWNGDEYARRLAAWWAASDH